MIITVLAMDAMMAGAAETQADGKATASPAEAVAAADASGEQTPVPAATSAALIGTIGLFMLLNRYRR